MPAAQAQDTGTYTSAPLDWGSSQAGLGRLQRRRQGRLLPRRDGAIELQCTLSTGRGFGATVHLRHRPGLSRQPHVGRRERQRRRRLLPPRRRRRRRTSASVLALHRHRLHRRRGQHAPAWGVNGRARRRQRRRQRRLLPDHRPNRATARRPARPTRRTRRSRPRSTRGRRTAAPGRTSTATARPTSAASPASLICTLSTGHRLQRQRQLARRPTSATSPGRVLGRRRRRRTADYCRRVGNGGADAAHRLHALDRPAASAQTSSPSRSSGATRPARLAWTSTATATATSAAPSRASAHQPQLFCTLWTPAGLRRPRSSPARPTSATPPAAPGSTTTATARSTTAGSSAAGGPTSASPARLASAPRSARCPPRARRRHRAPARARRSRRPASWSRSPTTTSVKGRWTAPHPPAASRASRAGATVKVTCKKGCSRKSYTVSKNVRAGRSRSRRWSASG